MTDGAKDIPVKTHISGYREINIPVVVTLQGTSTKDIPVKVTLQADGVKDVPVAATLETYRVDYGLYGESVYETAPRETIFYAQGGTPDKSVAATDPYWFIKSGASETGKEGFMEMGFGQNDTHDQSDANLAGFVRVQLDSTSGEGEVKIKPSLWFYPSSEPTTPHEGMIYYDDTANQFVFHNGTGWETLAGVSGSGTSGTITKWDTDGYTLTDSVITESSGNITMSGNLTTSGGNILCGSSTLVAASTVLVQAADGQYTGMNFIGATTDATHIDWSMNRRNDNQDFWIYSYNGTTYKNWLKFDYGVPHIDLAPGGTSQLLLTSTGGTFAGDLTVTGGNVGAGAAPVANNAFYGYQNVAADLWLNLDNDYNNRGCYIRTSSDNTSAGGVYSGFIANTTGTVTQAWNMGMTASANWYLRDATNSKNCIVVVPNTGSTTILGDLTVTGLSVFGPSSLNLIAQTSYLVLRADGSGQHMYFDAGGSFYWRDEDAARNVVASLVSSTGRLSLGYAGNTTDPIEILRFNTERSWSFRKRSTGASTRLCLESDTGGKEFWVGYDDGVTYAAKFRVNDVQTNCSVTLAHDVTVNGDLTVSGHNIGLGTAPVAGSAITTTSTNSVIVRAPYSSYHLWWQDDTLSTALISHAWDATYSDYIKIHAASPTAAGPTFWVCDGSSYNLMLRSAADAQLMTITSVGSMTLAGALIATANNIGNLNQTSDIGQQLEYGNATSATLRFDADNWRLYAGGTGGLGEIWKITQTGDVSQNGNLAVAGGLIDNTKATGVLYRSGSYGSLGNTYASASFIVGFNTEAHQTINQDPIVMTTHASVGARCIRMSANGFEFLAESGSVTAGNQVSTQIAVLNDSGTLQIDGDLTASGGDITATGTVRMGHTASGSFDEVRFIASGTAGQLMHNTSNGDQYLMANAYYDGTYKGNNSSYPSWRFLQIMSSDYVSWERAAATAGAPSWVQKMKLDASGNLTITGIDINLGGDVVLRRNAANSLYIMDSVILAGDFDCVNVKTQDMATVGVAWDECYADNWNNVSSWKTFSNPFEVLSRFGPTKEDEYEVDHSKIDDWLSARVKADIKNEGGGIEWEGGYVLKPEKAKANARKVYVEKLGKKVPVGNYADGYSDKDFQHEEAYSINKTQIVLIQAMNELKGENDNLKSLLTDLESRISLLENAS